jgi:hypothetical protein
MSEKSIIIDLTIFGATPSVTAEAIPEGVAPKIVRSIIMDFSDICFL